MAGLAVSSWATGTPTGVRAQAHSPALSITDLTDSLAVVTGGGGNVLVFDSSEGLILVNGGREERTGALVEFLAARWPGRSVHTLFNTDWHWDHTGANGALATAGASIVAHEYTKQYLATKRYVDWQDRTYPRRPTHALPTRTFYTSGELDAGNETIAYGHLGQAHTDGDIYVRFENANLIAAGDVVTVRAYPISDYTSGGWMGGLLTATKTLLDLADDQTRILPGAGPVRTRADLQAEHDMLEALVERFGRMMKQGMGAEDMLAAGATKEYDAEWGDPGLFVSTSYRGLWLHVRDLGGVV